MYIYIYYIIYIYTDTIVYIYIQLYVYIYIMIMNSIVMVINYIYIDTLQDTSATDHCRCTTSSLQVGALQIAWQG